MRKAKKVKIIFTTLFLLVAISAFIYYFMPLMPIFGEVVNNLGSEWNCTLPTDVIYLEDMPDCFVAVVDYEGVRYKVHSGETVKVDEYRYIKPILLSGTKFTPYESIRMYVKGAIEEGYYNTDIMEITTPDTSKSLNLNQNYFMAVNLKNRLKYPITIKLTGIEKKLDLLRVKTTEQSITITDTAQVQFPIDTSEVENIQYGVKYEFSAYGKTYQGTGFVYANYATGQELQTNKFPSGLTSIDELTLTDNQVNETWIKLKGDLMFYVILTIIVAIFVILLIKFKKKAIAFGFLAIVSGIMLVLSIFNIDIGYGEIFGYDDYLPVALKATDFSLQQPTYYTTDDFTQVSIINGGYSANIYTLHKGGVYNDKSEVGTFTPITQDSSLKIYGTWQFNCKYTYCRTSGYNVRFGDFDYKNSLGSYEQEVKQGTYQGTFVIEVIRSTETSAYDVYVNGQKVRTGYGNINFPFDVTSGDVNIEQVKYKPVVSCKFGGSEKNMLVEQDFGYGKTIKAYGSDMTLMYTPTGWCLDQPIRRINTDGITNSVELTMSLKQGNSYQVKQGELMTLYYLTDASYLGVRCAADEAYNVDLNQCTKAVGYTKVYDCEQNGGILVVDENGVPKYCEYQLETKYSPCAGTITPEGDCLMQRDIITGDCPADTIIQSDGTCLKTREVILEEIKVCAGTIINDKCYIQIPAQEGAVCIADKCYVPMTTLLKCAGTVEGENCVTYSKIIKLTQITELTNIEQRTNYIQKANYQQIIMFAIVFIASIGLAYTLGKKK